MRQGNDRGAQYRSGSYYKTDVQLKEALETRDRYQQVLARQGYSEITTELLEAGPFYYAEEYHQQYRAKNPQGYCGLGGTAVFC
jgi:peptide-methionine (S)-S-oxide reductase